MTSTNITHFQRANVNGAELEYEVRGSGEPVVLIHGAILADAFAPITPALSGAEETEDTRGGRYRVIRYHRRGFAGSRWRTDGVALRQVSVADQDLRRARHLGSR